MIALSGLLLVLSALHELSDISVELEIKHYSSTPVDFTGDEYSWRFKEEDSIGAIDEKTFKRLLREKIIKQFDDISLDIAYIQNDQEGSNITPGDNNKSKRWHAFLVQIHRGKNMLQNGLFLDYEDGTFFIDNKLCYVIKEHPIELTLMSKKQAEEILKNNKTFKAKPRLKMIWSDCGTKLNCLSPYWLANGDGDEGGVIISMKSGEHFAAPPIR